MSPGGVLSIPGPEDLVLSLSYSDRYVLVVSLPFRGVSCSVPCFPLLNSAFSWKGSLGFARCPVVLGSRSAVGPTSGTSREVGSVRDQRDQL